MLFWKNDKEDAQAVMDTLSEKYKGFEDELIDITGFKVIIVDLETAYVDSKYSSGRNYEHYKVRLKWYHKIVGLKISNLIDGKIKTLKNKYSKSNNKIKELIDLKAKYNDTSATMNTISSGLPKGIYMPSAGLFSSSNGTLTTRQVQKELKKRGII